MPAPIALRPEQVPDDLICSICMTIPVNPVLTPCEHLFCSGCIRQALSVSRQCPIDRTVCNVRDLRELRNGCLFRIWSNIQVKCENHNDGCAWTGSIGDYANHLERCRSSSGQSDSALREELEAVKQENTRLILQLQSHSQSNSALREELERVKLDNTMLKLQLAIRPNLPRLFDGEYNYRRENVIELSQLISRYLENKPADIDSNRIYNCVRACYMDLEKDFNDNPKHYGMDMKMLLATCEASNWFSDRQRSSICDWYRDQF